MPEAKASSGNNSIIGTHRNQGEILLSIADQIVAGGSHHDLFDKLAPSVRDLGQCDVVAFSLYDAAQKRIVTDFWKSGERAGRPQTYPVDESPGGWVWEHQEVLRIPDLDQETRFPGVVQYLRNLGMLSYAALPMSTPKHRYGALGIGVGARDAESLRNLVPLARAARLVGFAIENQKVHSEWEKQQGRLRALAEINRELSQPGAVQTLPAVLTGMRRITDCEYARVELLDPDADSLRVGSVVPWVCEWLELEEGQRIPLEKSMAAQAVSTRRVTFHDVDEITKSGCIVAGEARNYGLRSFACVPLLLGNHVQGVLLLGAVRRNAFSTSDAPYLYQIGVQVAAVLHSTEETRAAVAIHPLSQKGERRAGPPAAGAGRWDEIVGNSSALRRVLEQAEDCVGISRHFIAPDDCAKCTLHRSGEFCHLEKGPLELLSGVGHITFYPAYATLLKEGQMSPGVYIVCSGRVKLSVETTSGKTVILKVAERRQVLGLSTVVTGRPAPVTATTMDLCQIKFVERDNFMRLMEGDARIALTCARLLAQEVVGTFDDVYELLLARSSTEKLVRLLLSWVAEEPHNRNLRVASDFTHEEMAQMIGSSRETVTRLLCEMRRKELIRIEGSTLVIPNRVALQAIA